DCSAGSCCRFRDDAQPQCAEAEVKRPLWGVERQSFSAEAKGSCHRQSAKVGFSPTAWLSREGIAVVFRRLRRRSLVKQGANVLPEISRLPHWHLPVPWPTH